MSVYRLPTVSCPHCEGQARVRTSRAVTRLYRELRYACENVECGFTFKAELVITNTISPSARPRRDVHLPPIGPPPAHNDNLRQAAAAGR